MKPREIERFRLKLEAFLADVVLPMGRTERRQHAEEYVRGLLMDGERKSIEPMADRLPDGDVQALQQFVNQSPWPSREVRASLARKVEQEFVPGAYWLVDEVSFPKQGKHSVGVARQYCGALGKTANCQVAVTLDLGQRNRVRPWIGPCIFRSNGSMIPCEGRRLGFPKRSLSRRRQSWPWA